MALTQLLSVLEVCNVKLANRKSCLVNLLVSLNVFFSPTRSNCGQSSLENKNLLIIGLKRFRMLRKAVGKHVL